MLTVQRKIMQVMNELGYADCENGVCAGLALMWVQACLCDDEQKFSDRIKLICQPDFVKHASRLSTKIAYLKSDIKMSEEEMNIKEALVFLDGVQSYSKPYLLKEFFGNYYYQNDFIPISSYINSIKMENQGGICMPYSEVISLDEQELNDYFIKLHSLLSKGEKSGWGKCAFTLTTREHRIGFRFNPETDYWQISNLSGVILLDKSWLGNFNNPITQLQTYANTIIPSSDISQMARLSCALSGITTASISLFTTNTNPGILEIINSFAELKNNHIVTQQMIQQANAQNKSIALLTIQNNDLKTLKNLVKNGLDVNDILYKKENYPITLLTFSIEIGRHEITQFLLENGANINNLNITGGLPALLTDEMSVEMLDVLFHHGIALNEHEIQPKYPAKLNKSQLDFSPLMFDGYYLSHCATLSGSIKAIDYLANKKLDFNQHAFSFMQYTPTHTAALNGNEALVDTLKKNGADLNIPCMNGQRPIHTASGKGNIPFISALIKQGVSPDQLDDCQNSIAHYAIDPNVNSIRRTIDIFHITKVAAHKNTQANQATTIHFLSTLPVDLDAKNKNGLTPFHLALNKGNADAIIALMQHGVDINQLFPDGRKPISVAITNKHWDAAILYLLTNIELNTNETKILNQNRAELVDAFIHYIENKTDPVEKQQIVLSVINSNNTLGKVLNTFVTTLGFSYSSYKYNGKSITHSIAKIIDEFPVDQEQMYSQALKV